MPGNSINIKEIIISNPPATDIKVVKTTKQIILKSQAGIIIDDEKYMKKKISDNAFIINSAMLEFYDEVLMKIRRILVSKKVLNSDFNELINYIEMNLPKILYELNSIFTEKFKGKKFRLKLVYNLYESGIPLLFEGSKTTGPFLTMIVGFNGSIIRQFYLGFDYISKSRIPYTNIVMTSDLRFSFYTKQYNNNKLDIKKSGPTLIIGFSHT